MSGKRVRHNQERRPRNWVARQMIIERVGINSSDSMRERPDKKLRILEEDERSWRDEDWGDD